VEEKEKETTSDTASYDFVGCFRDKQVRAIPQQADVHRDREKCKQKCLAIEGVNYMGLQHDGCFCGNNYARYGNTGGNCDSNGVGGDWTNSVYRINNVFKVVEYEIGNGNNDGKTISFNEEQYSIVCPSEATKNNWVNDQSYGDIMPITVDNENNKITATRKCNGNPCGWGMHLKILCTVNPGFTKAETKTHFAEYSDSDFDTLFNAIATNGGYVTQEDLDAEIEAEKESVTQAAEQAAEEADLAEEQIKDKAEEAEEEIRDDANEQSIASQVTDKIEDSEEAADADSGKGVGDTSPMRTEEAVSDAEAEEMASTHIAPEESGANADAASKSFENQDDNCAQLLEEFAIIKEDILAIWKLPGQHSAAQTGLQNELAAKHAELVECGKMDEDSLDIEVSNLEQMRQQIANDLELPSAAGNSLLQSNFLEYYESHTHQGLESHNGEEQSAGNNDIDAPIVNDEYQLDSDVEEDIIDDIREVPHMAIDKAKFKNSKSTNFTKSDVHISRSDESQELPTLQQDPLNDHETDLEVYDQMLMENHGLLV